MKSTRNGPASPEEFQRQLAEFMRKQFPGVTNPAFASDTGDTVDATPAPGDGDEFRFTHKPRADEDPSSSCGTTRAPHRVRYLFADRTSGCSQQSIAITTRVAGPPWRAGGRDWKACSTVTTTVSANIPMPIRMVGNRTMPATSASAAAKCHSKVEGSIAQ